MLNTENSAQPRGLLAGMVARAWAVALRRTGDMANKAPFHLPGVSYELDRRNGTNTDFFRSYIYHISYLAKEYTKNTMMVNVTLVVVRISNLLPEK